MLSWFHQPKESREVIEAINSFERECAEVVARLDAVEKILHELQSDMQTIKDKQDE